jgi:hypothetical protein
MTDEIDPKGDKPAGGDAKGETNDGDSDGSNSGPDPPETQPPPPPDRYTNLASILDPASRRREEEWYRREANEAYLRWELEEWDRREEERLRREDEKYLPKSVMSELHPRTGTGYDFTSDEQEAHSGKRTSTPLPLTIGLGAVLLVLVALFISWLTRDGESATQATEQSATDSFESSPDPVDPSSSDDAAIAGAEDTAAADASTDDRLPVLVNPCAVIGPERAATLLGAVVGEPAWSDEGDNARFGQESWNNCRYEVGSSTNLLLSFHINVVLSQRADEALADWLDEPDHRSATEIRSVEWAPDGALRAHLQHPNLLGIDEETYAFARMWATVIKGDDGAHDLYIEIDFQNVPGVSVAATADIVAEAGKIINDAILAAQP